VGRRRVIGSPRDDDKNHTATDHYYLIQNVMDGTLM